MTVEITAVINALVVTLTCSKRYRMKVVFPVLYCPTSITIGLMLNHLNPPDWSQNTVPLYKSALKMLWQDDIQSIFIKTTVLTMMSQREVEMRYFASKSGSSRAGE